MLVGCGGLLQPPHLPLLSAPGWDTRQPGPGHSDDDCMQNCSLVQVDATEYNLSMSIVFFLFMFICSKNVSGVLMLCSTQAGLATNTNYHNTDSDLAWRAATGSPAF